MQLCGDDLATLVPLLFAEVRKLRRQNRRLVKDRSRLKKMVQSLKP